MDYSPQGQITPQGSKGGGLPQNQVSFNTSQKMQNTPLPSDFVPLEYSSPMNHGKNNWKSRRNNSQTPKGPYRFGNNSNNSRNSGSGSNYFRGNNKNKNHSRGAPQHDTDISRYFHPSMLEDPWADLEKRRIALSEDTGN